jgi:hypothetical protein
MNNYDFYLNHSHTKDTVTLKVERYYIDNIPVCLSWAGCDKHEKECCKFLLSKKFGSIYVCGLTLDTKDVDDEIPTVMQNCPLHNGYNNEG